jgi:hypothetical protein
MAPAPAAAASPRLEPLLWIQLVGLGALPLEALLLLLLLAGNDPGPVPELERLFCWTLGALGPLLLFWRRPADPWSLLFVQTPLRGRRQLQQRLSALQESTLLRIALLLGAAAELPLLWWLDRHAAVAAALTPFGGTPRLVDLLAAALLLALMLWQWHQGVQALWLLGRNAAAIEAATPLNLEQLEQGRLCLGLPLLLPDPLKAPPAAAVPEAPSAAVPAGPRGPSEVAAASEAPDEASGGGAAAIAVEPEEPTEDEKGADLEDEVG